MEEIPKLTELERLMLANQYRILAVLDEPNGSQHTQHADILQQGHVGLYGDIFDSLSEGSSEEELTEVDDILTMFNFIDNALEELTPEQRQQLDLTKLSFSGFDGNRDKHYTLTKFLIEKMDRFQEYAGRPLNSHTSSSLPKYRKMLAIFNAAREGHFDVDLTFEELQNIAAA